MNHLHAPEALAETSLMAQAVSAADAIAAEAASRFAAMLPRVVHQVLGDGPDAQQALQTGGFVLDDSVIVMRLNPDTDTLEFFCDIGLPPPHSLEANFRAALEMNLCRTYPGVTFGVHPESGRLVATSAMHMMLFSDDEVCLNALQMLAGLVKQLRANRTFIVED